MSLKNQVIKIDGMTSVVKNPKYSLRRRSNLLNLIARILKSNKFIAYNPSLLII